MKKITLVYVFALLFGITSNAQIIDDCGCWPNALWTVTGTYNSDPSAFEANPTVTSSFAFDDDDAGNSSDDDIAAESPVINLTAAQSGGETALTVTATYVYDFLADSLTLEYWDADASNWVAWTSFAENDNSTTNDFCTGTSSLFTSTDLDISSFTATQLSGFRYRISYLDDGGAGGAAWEWGFCVQSPTITSRNPALSVVDLELKEGLKLFPNPMQNNLTISANSSIETIAIINMVGQTVKNVSVNSNLIDLNTSNLKAGLYFIEISINGNKDIIKLLKN